jgi:hypothetical protein
MVVPTGVVSGWVGKCICWFWLSLRAPHHCNPRRESAPQGVQQPRRHPHVIGQFFSLVPQDLNLGLGRRLGNRQAANLAVCVPERHRRLGGS